MHDPDNITAWQRIDDRTTTSGKLVADNVQQLADLGVRHVINLSMGDHPEALNGEADLLQAAGIRYTHIPVPFDAPTDAHYESFVQAYEADDEPVHVPCIANMRVSAFLYRYHRDRKRMPEEDARALMEAQWSPDTSDHPVTVPWAKFIDTTS